MSRIPAHTVDDAPAASRALLQNIVQSTPSGHPANVHAQIAHSPAVLAVYTSLRAAITNQSPFSPEVGSALTLAAASGVGTSYMMSIARRLAEMNGWTEEQVAALSTGASLGDARIDTLTRLVRQATNSGKVDDATWDAAQRAGWNDDELADAFVYLGATVFTGFFLNYAQTEMDL